MPININFRNTNELLQRFLPYLMQQKLGEQSAKRQMDVYSYEDKLRREAAAQADVYTRRGIEQRHKTAEEEATAEFERSVKKLPYVNQLFMEYQKSPTPEIESKIKEVGTLYDVAYGNLQQGKPIPGEVMAKLVAIDPRSEIINNIISNFTSRSGQEIEKGRLGLEGQKFGLERQKFGAEQGTVGKSSGEKYKSNKASEINNALSFMVPFARGGGISEDGSTIATGDDALDRALMTSLRSPSANKQNYTQYAEAAGTLSEELTNMLNSVYNGDTLTPEQDKLISMSRNPAKMLKWYVDKNNARPVNTMTAPTTDFGKPSMGGAVEQEPQIPAPAVTAPAATPQVPSMSGADLPPGTYIEVNTQTGERKAYINGQWIRIR